MAWGRCDDTFYRHAKVGELDPEMELAAVGLYWKALSWSNDQLTDGRVPVNVVRMLGGSVALADELVRVGLWEREGRAYLVHDFDQYNRTKAQVVADRAQRSIAGKRGADARWGAHGGSPSELHSETHGEVPYEPNGEMDAPYPVPRVPVTRIPKVPRADARTSESGTWPADVPLVVQGAWHRRMKRPPTTKQVDAIRMKPSTWHEVALLIDAAPAGAKSNDIVCHVLDGLTAELSAERREESQRAAQKEPGRPGGTLTPVGDSLPVFGPSGGGRR